MPISTIGTDGLSTSPTLTTPKATTTIGVGNATPSASGAGITFPATQSASTDANTLDDYEEGTWTPTNIGMTVNSGSWAATGKYTKIGRTVFITVGQTSGNVSASAGTGLIGGLPFTPAQSSIGGYSNGATTLAGVCSCEGNNVIYGATAFSSQNSLQFSATYTV
jgi:hypothetical protein